METKQAKWKRGNYKPTTMKETDYQSCKLFNEFVNLISNQLPSFTDKEISSYLKGNNITVSTQLLHKLRYYRDLNLTKKNTITVCKIIYLY